MIILRQNPAYSKERIKDDGTGRRFYFFNLLFLLIGSVTVKVLLFPQDLRPLCAHPHPLR